MSVYHEVRTAEMHAVQCIIAASVAESYGESTTVLFFSSMLSILQQRELFGCRKQGLLAREIFEASFRRVLHHSLPAIV